MRHARFVVALAALTIVACDQALTPTLAGLGGGTVTSAGDTAIVLVISPANPTITVGQTVQMTTNAATSLLPLVWTSSDPTIATVSATGLVHAINPGPVTITATSSVDTLATGSALATVSGG